MALCIRLFGHPKISGEQHAPPLRRRALLLLAYLALRRGVWTERVRVAADLYPDSNAVASRAQLRRTLLDLYAWLNACGCASAVEYTSARLRILELGVSVDVWEWQDARDRNDYARAIELYSAELLVNFDEAWIVALREVFARIHRDDVYCAMEHALALRPELVLRYGEACLRDNPYDERAIRAVMKARAFHGDRIGALQVYHDFAERLCGELQADPEQATIDLQRAIEGSRPWLVLQHVSPAAHRVSEALAAHRWVTFIAEATDRDEPLDEIVSVLSAQFPDGVRNIDGELTAASHFAREIGTRRVCLVLDFRNRDDRGTCIAIERILQDCANAHVVSISASPLYANGECIVDARLGPSG